MADSEKRPSNGDVITQHHEGVNGGGVIEKNDSGIPSKSSTPPSDGVATDAAHQKLKMSRKLANPLAGIDTATLEQMGEDYCRKHNIGGASEENIRAFRLGAVISSDPSSYTGDGEYGGGGVVFDRLTDKEKTALRREETHKWSNPWPLYSVIIICSLSAAVQGMDETVVNGAQIFYKRAFKINSGSDRDEWLVGLCNSAPYLCCAFIGSWLTEPMNKAFGRKGTVFIACIVSALACFWQAFTNTWYHMFIARFCLGLGIGPKSATTPMFAAECAPPRLRGALVMQWQMWTAFGIMVGYIADLAFYFVPDRGIELGLNWRLMMGSAMIPAVLVCCLIHTCVESPRWYLTKDRHADAFDVVCRLRFEKVQAARDLFYMHTLLEAEKEINMNGSNSTFARLKEMWTVRRNRNAMIASEIVMFMQQFCGVNVLAYYSSQIFLDAQLSEVSALGASVGWGVINWLFAIPAIYTIDTFGRRNLLLTTFPLMAIFLLFTGFSFWIPSSESHPNDARIACVALGVYLFAIVYSPGEGPVPFTYSAEAYPLYLRPLGMSLATATTWFFNFILSVTWPSLLKAFKPQGAFGWYAGWNIVGFFAVLFFMPETKAKTLEELDAVFSVSLRKRMQYGLDQSVYFIRRYIFLGGKSIEAPQEPIADEYLEHYQEKHHLPARQPQPDSTARV